MNNYMLCPTKVSSTLFSGTGVCPVSTICPQRLTGFQDLSIMILQADNTVETIWLTINQSATNQDTFSLCGGSTN